MSGRIRIATVAAAAAWLVALGAGAPLAAGADTSSAKACKDGAKPAKASKRPPCPKAPAGKATPAQPSLSWPVGNDDYVSCWLLVQEPRPGAWHAC